MQPTSVAQPTQPGQSAPFSLTENADYALSDEFFARAKQLLEKRVSPHRFTHCCSVARYSAHLAKLYHYPEKEARIAGLLHDWDKAYTNDDIRARALAFKTRIDGEVLDFLPALLHGPTGACALEVDFPFLDGRILVSSLFNAFVSLIKAVADTDTKLPAITFWLMGGLSSTTLDDLRIVFIFPSHHGSFAVRTLEDKRACNGR